MIENFLFFEDGLPHPAPGPYVAFRIDDLPVTGESYIKQGYSDAKACAEINDRFIMASAFTAPILNI